MSRAARLVCLFVLVFAALGPAGRALAGNACTPQSIELYGNYETMSVYVSYAGDDNDNASAAVQFRPGGAGDWQAAQPLARISGDRFAGSIFGLAPATSYQVRVNFTDPDGVSPDQLTASASTRSEQRPTGSGRTMYVSTGGSNGWPGTQQQPYRTIQYAVDQAGPGDVIVVTPGTYREWVHITSSGQAGAYILLQGQAGAKITGAEEAFEQTPNGLWTHVSGDLYYTPMTTKPVYIAAEGQRLYYWTDLAGLQRGSETISGKTYYVDGGWAYDGAADKLYVRLPDGRDPNNVAIQLTRNSYGVVIEEANYWILDGLDIGFSGDYCVAIKGGSRCVVRSCVMHNARNGLRLDRANADEHLIDGNEFYDTSVWDWPWKMVKAHDPEGCAIYPTGGRGNVYRNNSCHGFFNAIAPSLWGQLYDERYNRDMDVHHNEIWETGDDSLEPEGACMNQRYWNNSARGVLVGISLAPITVGPCYFIRNTIYDHHLTSVKLDNGTDGPVFLYHNTLVTTVTDTDRYSYRKYVNGIGNSGAYHNHTYRNNIIQGTNYVYYDWLGTSPVGLDMDHDNLYTTHSSNFFYVYQHTYPTLGLLRSGTGLEMHGMNQASGFVDLGAGDLRLTAGSPLIDQGVLLPNINDDYSGQAPDIGANEFPSTYCLTVNSGSGDGQYAPGSVVSIAADPAPTGQVFDRWVGDTAGVAETQSAGTTITMPASDVEITAAYTDILYNLTVNSGTGDGQYVAGQVVAILADTAPPHMVFRRWIGETAGIADVDSAATTLTMPAADAEVTATCKYPGDLNDDGFIGQIDLDIVLDNWGLAIPPGDPRADPSGDDIVGQTDLDYVLDSWGMGTLP